MDRDYNRESLIGPGGWLLVVLGVTFPRFRRFLFSTFVVCLIIFIASGLYIAAFQHSLDHTTRGSVAVVAFLGSGLCSFFFFVVWLLSKIFSKVAAKLNIIEEEDPQEGTDDEPEIIRRDPGFTTRQGALDAPPTTLPPEPVRPPSSDGGVAEHDIASRLSAVAKLYSEGLLSAEEFEKSKQKLLHEAAPQGAPLAQRDWFYLRGDDRMGPFSEREFKSLVFTRQIKARTLVWHAGMADWIPLERCDLRI
jgi:hypothetical protein